VVMHVTGEREGGSGDGMGWGSFALDERRNGPGGTHPPRPLLSCACGYGPTPPLWQSEQLTALRSPSSIGCLKVMAVLTTEAGSWPSSSERTVWQELHSLVMTLPSLLVWLPSWQRKQPLK